MFQLNTADSRFQALFNDAEYNIDTTSGKYVKTKEMEKLIGGKVLHHEQKLAAENKRKREADDAENADSNKKQKTDTSEKKKDAHLESLIKSVKAKTQMLEKDKQEKRKKKRKNDF